MTGDGRQILGAGMRRRSWAFMAAIAVWAATGCADDETIEGPQQVGQVKTDAKGSLDSGVGDVGPVDVGLVDVGTADVGTADAKPEDVPATPDTTLDAGGPEDGGGQTDDAAAPDGEQAPDAAAQPDAASVSTLCDPCKASADCGGPKDACVDLGAAGAFCGQACDDAADCPATHQCLAVSTVEGVKVTQCVPVPETFGGPPGACACSSAASAAGLSTTCYKPSFDPDGAEVGKCMGARSCTGGGLTACDAPDPAPESCDGVDNDCDGQTDEGTCSDDNACTVDACDGAAGCSHKPVADGQACDDGDACTAGEACAAGSCGAGKAKGCDDGDTCTADACDPATGKCGHKPIAGCGAPCQTDASCPGDGDTCTVAFCDQAKGKCGVKAAADGSACEDGDACTTGDACVKGKCGAGKPLGCDDGQPCTHDGCNPASGDCSHVPETDGTACQDGDACTAKDACLKGKCAPGAAKSCDDGDPCTLDGCNPTDGKCTHVAAGACNICANDQACKPTGDACLKATCDIKAGKCTLVPTDAACDDGDACTVSDKCAGGKCGGKKKDCDDGQPCTDDTCDGPQGGCTHAPAAGSPSCSDGDACTTGDQCSGGKCLSGKKNTCDDGEPCTDDTCDGATGLCSHAPNSAPCSDGDLCTNQDTCSGGKCAGSVLPCTPKKCHTGACDAKTGACVYKPIAGCGEACKADADCKGLDGPCTKGVCIDKKKGCEVKPVGGPCDDGLACSAAGSCQQGKCAPGPDKSCDDKNVCTTDKCDPKTGACVHAPAAPNTACDDDDPCTLAEACKGSKCGAGAPKTCDDGEICTADACHPASGVCTFAPAPKGKPCSDGDACTAGDACAAGKCVPGAATGCDDGNKCTVDACDAKTGACSHSPVAGCGGFCKADADCKQDDDPCTINGCAGGTCKVGFTDLSCEDGDKCTSGDVCAAGKCKPGDVAACDDGNGCTVDKCDPTTGTCASKPVATGAPCDDGDACTAGDKCQAGKCVAGVGKTCDDGNPCTADKCDPKTGLCGAEALANGTPCEDGSPCTVKDTCSGGKCASGTPKGCEDGDACTADKCDPKTGACGHKAIPGCGGYCMTDGDCKDDADPCTAAFCDLKAKKCSSAPAPGKCDDGNPCTEGDACDGGQCQGSVKSCDDGKACTVDACKDGKCVWTATPAGSACSDGKACTVGDACKNGKCVAGTVKVCASTNPCVAGTCNDTTGECAFAAVVDGKGCSDGNKCTTGDACKLGKCKPGKPTACDDGDACTLDACDLGTGKCSHVPTPGCGGFCLVNKHCPQDANPCTKSVCDVGAKKCAVAFVSNPCSDKNGCTVGDKCVAGVCTGVSKPCNDKNPCTIDACVGKWGACTHKAVPQGYACSDGDACTLGDQCLSGKCVPASKQSCDDNNTCTADVCIKSTGKCVNVPLANGKACSDADPCTVGDVCAAGSCKPGSPKGCDDGDPCTADACDAKGACTHAKIDGCGGNCGGDADCKQDGDPCTVAFCDKAKGKCGAKPTTADCNDGKPCTSGDKCAAGACAGVAVDCDDKNVCTADSCNASTGACVHAPLGKTTVCSDGDKCTVADRCEAGACKAGWTKKCTDDNACTKDVCDPKTGNCSSTALPSGSPCTDGNACTLGDKCVGGKCKKGAPKSCKDKDGCTADLCDIKTGKCSHKPVPGCGGYCDQHADCKQDANPCSTAYCNAKLHKCQVAFPGGGCSDGDPCTIYDKCNGAGQCSGTPRTCTDKNPCSIGACNPATGSCTQKPAPNGTGCNDGSPCTTAEICWKGKCTGGQKKNCSDANPCTWDVCAKTTGECLHYKVTNGTGCGDGDACTVGDICVSGKCQPGKPKLCNDGEPCTADACDGSSGKCTHVAIPGCGGACKADTDCKEDANICTKAYCNQALGKCSFANVGGGCDDGSPCTHSDKCTGGKCAGTTKYCWDGNPCTFDSCDEKDGSCTHGPGADGTKCYDGNGCTWGDICVKGKCTGQKTKNCNDGNVCTVESCDKKTGLCGYKPAPKGTLCNDKDPCSLKDTCEGGKCVAGKPKNCDDGKACTLDLCHSGNGKCKHTPIPGCGGNCKVDAHCKQDKNACTKNVCDKVKGKCVSTQVNGACNDGKPCTQGDTCQSGICVGQAKSCGDANPCTADWCQGSTGKCLHVAKGNGVHCYDGDPCTYADQCKSGVCSGTKKNCDDNNTCTLDTCNGTNGACQHQLVYGCGGNCSKNSHCKQDANPCRVNVCDVKLHKCMVKDVNGLCGDGDPCTIKDTCANGKCVSGPVKSCKDGNACTLDTCKTGTGACVHTQIPGCKTCKNHLQCNDGKPCTVDKCNLGKCDNVLDPKCKPCASYKECGDGNACTTDACVGGKCLNLAIAGCKPCTKNWQCIDKNPCTQDLCHKLGFCYNLPMPGCVPCQDGGDCNDADKCTIDTCLGHKCNHTPIPGCK